MITGQKILVTGATGEVARRIAENLAPANEIWCAARFTDPPARARLEAQGMRCVPWTLGEGDFAGLPQDFDSVIHSACNIFPVRNDYDAAIRANAEGTGLLMGHCRTAKAFLYVSSLNIYAEADDNSRPRLESDPLGCHPSYAPSYSTGKVATEAVVRTLARLYGMPTIIARLGMNYGAGVSGVPDFAFRDMLAGRPVIVPPPGRSFCALINNQDVVDQVAPLLAAATVPATIVNWCGDETIDERDMYDYVAELARQAGLDPQLEERADAGHFGGVGDQTRRKAITGPCRYGWKQGILEMLRANYPELVFSARG